MIAPVTIQRRHTLPMLALSGFMIVILIAKLPAALGF